MDKHGNSDLATLVLTTNASAIYKGTTTPMPNNDFQASRKQSAHASGRTSRHRRLAGLLFVMSAFLMPSCDYSGDVPVIAPSKTSVAASASGEAAMKEQFRQEIMVAASANADHRITVGVSLLKLGNADLLDTFCHWDDVNVVAVIYHVPSIIGGIYRLPPGTHTRCATLLRDHVVRAIPDDVRRASGGLDDASIRNSVEIEGLFLAGSVPQVLSHWDSTSNVRTMRLSPENLSVAVPTPGQPLSTFDIR